MLRLQLFDAAALHAARDRQQKARLEARRPGERPVAALDASLGELARKSPDIHRFVIERFILAQIPVPLAVAFGLVTSRFLLAFPLEAVRRSTLRYPLLCTWYAFRYGPGVEEAWRLEVLARIAGRLAVAFEYDLAVTLCALLHGAGVDRATVEYAANFARTLMLAVFATIHHETSAPQG